MIYRDLSLTLITTNSLTDNSCSKSANNALAAKAIRVVENKSSKKKIGKSSKSIAIQSVCGWCKRRKI